MSVQESVDLRDQTRIDHNFYKAYHKNSLFIIHKP